MFPLIACAIIVYSSTVLSPFTCHILVATVLAILHWSTMLILDSENGFAKNNNIYFLLVEVEAA